VAPHIVLRPMFGNDLGRLQRLLQNDTCRIVNMYRRQFTFYALR